MTCCVYCWVRSQRLEPASFVLDGMSCCEPCGRPMLEIIGRNIRDYEAKGRRDE